jgi:hypothetical protein
LLGSLGDRAIAHWSQRGAMTMLTDRLRRYRFVVGLVDQYWEGGWKAFEVAVKGNSTSACLQMADKLDKADQAGFIGQYLEVVLPLMEEKQKLDFAIFLCEAVVRYQRRYGELPDWDIKAPRR